MAIAFINQKGISLREYLDQAQQEAERQKMSPRVFLSYAFDDRAFVEQEIAPFFDRHGIAYWRAEVDTQTNLDWDQEITSGLESCDWFLVVVSPRAAKSEWVRNEVAWAMEHRQDRILPVLIEDCPSHELHLGLGAIHHADFRYPGDKARRELLKVWGIEFQGSAPIEGQLMPVVIVQRFAARMEALAAKKMSEYLKRRISPEDVVQSVFADYFRRVADNQIETRDWDSVWGLLARMTVWEICRQSAHYQAARRTLDREVPLEEGEGIGREPQAEDLAMASDLYEQLLKGIPEKYRPIWRQS